MNLVLSFEYNTEVGGSYLPQVIATSMTNFNDREIYNFISSYVPNVKNIKNLSVYVGTAFDYFAFVGLDESVEDIQRISGAFRARQSRFGRLLSDNMGRNFVPGDTTQTELPKPARVILPCTQCRFYTPPRDTNSMYDDGKCSIPMPPDVYPGMLRKGTGHKERGCVLGEQKED